MIERLTNLFHWQAATSARTWLTALTAVAVLLLSGWVESLLISFVQLMLRLLGHVGARLPRRARRMVRKVAGSRAPRTLIRLRRRTRLRLAALSALLAGLVMLVMEMLWHVAGFGYDTARPWLLTMAMGFVAGELAVYLKGRLLGPAFRLVTAAVLLATSISWVDGPPAGAQPGPGTPTCPVSVRWHTIDGEADPEPLDATGTTRDNPIDVPFNDIDRVWVYWQLPPGFEAGEKTWSLDVLLPMGFTRRVRERLDTVRQEREGRVFAVTRLTAEIQQPRILPPGTYRLSGRIDGVCSTTAFFRIVDRRSPFPYSVAVAAAVVARRLVRRVRDPLLDRPDPDDGPPNPTRDRSGDTEPGDDGTGGSEADDLHQPGRGRPDVEVEIIDLATGQPATRPLIRGTEYAARVRLNLPDGYGDYRSLEQPFEIGVEVDHSDAQPEWRTVWPVPPSVTTDLPIRFPPGQQASLHVAVSMNGAVLQTQLLSETVRPGRSFNDAIYRLAGVELARFSRLAADRLRDLPSYDANLCLRQVDKETVRVAISTAAPVTHQWLLVDPADVADVLNASVRTNLRNTLQAWSRSQAIDDPARRRGAESDMMTFGRSLRQLLLPGHPPLLPAGARVQLVPESNGVGLTIPWGLVFDGQAGTDSDRCGQCPPTGQPAGCCDDRPGFCINKLWGYRHQVDWVYGSRDYFGDDTDRYGGGSAVAARAVARNLRPLARKAEDTRRLTVIISTKTDGGEPLALDGVVARHGPTYVSTARDFAHMARSWRQSDVVYVCCLGRPAGLSGAEGRSSLYTLDLGPHLQITADLLRARERTLRLSRGALVILNACESSPELVDTQHNLVQALFRLGASGLVVTESLVDADVAWRVGPLLLQQALSDDGLDSGSLLSLRRSYLADQGDLGLLSYNYLGPDRRRTGRGRPTWEAEVFHV